MSRLWCICSSPSVIRSLSQCYADLTEMQSSFVNGHLRMSSLGISGSMVLRTLSTWWVDTGCLIASAFHHLWSWSIHCAGLSTLLRLSVVSLASSRFPGTVVTHWSWNALIERPSPIDHTPPSRITSRSESRLDHAQEALFPLTTWMKSVEGKLIVFKTRTKRAFGSFITLSAILANIATLKSCNSLKPNPPCYFSLVIVSQRFQCIFLSRFWLPAKISQSSH